MGILYWNEFFSDSNKRVRVGDKVYDEDLFIGIISEVKTPFIGHAKATISLASREAHLFIQEKTGINDWDSIRIYEKTWNDRIIDWINKIYDSLRSTKTEEEK